MVGEGAVFDVAWEVTAADWVGLEKNDLLASLPVLTASWLSVGCVGVEGNGWKVERKGCFSDLRVMAALMPLSQGNAGGKGG
jgi:hypothetical protein